MSNKIKAAIRVRPFLASQKKKGYANNILQINKQNKQICVKEDSTLRKFHFDYLFSEQDTQQDVYQTCKVDSLIDKALQGYHSTIFAYGQTGSGKTYTMQGSQEFQQGNRVQINGIIPKVIKNLFCKINENRHNRTYIISVSFLQIYNQKIFDLLNPSSLNNKNLASNINGLRLRWNKDEQFSVENLFVFQCKNEQELTKFFVNGLKNRISSAHKLNMQSSRSHSILTIRVESFDPSNPNHILSSKIQLVDLAGSERIGLTGTQGRLAKESIDINKSLFTLRQVISILSEVGKTRPKQKTYVPYRDSKLTSILKQSIGGNSYSLMIACINPNDSFFEQNVSTLTYATKASYITNQPVINDDPRNKLINQLKKQVKQLNQQLGKANQHIQFISNLNSQMGNTQTNISTKNSNVLSNFNQTGQTGFNVMNQTQKSGNIGKQDISEDDLPVPIFKKRFTQKINSNYGQFSQRLIQSINMVRQLLKSNKQLRQQLETNNRVIQQKDLQIFQLTRQNQLFRQKISGTNMQDLNYEVNYSPEERPSSNFKPRNTVNISNTANMKASKPTGTMYSANNRPSNKSSQAKGNFNYWNSVEINQFYMNERGIDSIPTNFNKRQINTAQQKRIISSSRGKSSETDRHAITAKISSRRNWMSKNSEPKKFLSFYNDPNKQPEMY